ncbi:hypothetical protein ABZS76_33015 [Streptomyces sp. NPDC005562]|uniref:hypothetical protein n=1 Tax=Streptomyces sp. NPDC005562 TaxID=3154890 RepID=UPI0033B5C289
MTHGTCLACLRKITVNKDGSLREHNHPVKPQFGSGKSPRCDGAGRNPLETTPITGETLQAVVRAVIRQALTLGEWQRETHVAQALLQHLGPRLRQLEGENAMLADTVMTAAGLWFEEITDPGVRNAASEALHLTAEDLKTKYPRLRE